MKINTDRKIAVVTGAAGDLGQAISKTLTMHGYEVAAADLRPVPDTTYVTRSYELDVTQVESCNALIVDIERDFGQLDLLVNNAGANAFGSSIEADPDTVQGVVATNLLGTFYLSQTAYRLLAQTRGSIVNIGSSCGTAATTQSAVYCATKAAIIHLTRCLAKEWAADGVRVNAVSPGIVPTAMNYEKRQDEDYLSAKLAEIPLGKMTEATQVAAAVTWLASGEASSITGHNLAVDGGVTL